MTPSIPSKEIENDCTSMGYLVFGMVITIHRGKQGSKTSMGPSQVGNLKLITMEAA
jgi:hypothetical protein